MNWGRRGAGGPDVTENEWDACTDPQPMLDFLQGRASDRKMWLFAVACCRRLWGVFLADECRRAVEVAERFADGRATEEQNRPFSAAPLIVGCHHLGGGDVPGNLAKTLT